MRSEMNIMELSAYNKYLEPCCMCDSERTKIRVVEREALGDLEFSYNQLGVLCLDCGFSFVNSALSAITLKNRDEAEQAAIRYIKINALKRRINTPVITLGGVKRHSTSTLSAIFNRENNYLTLLGNSFKEVETIHTHSNHTVRTVENGVGSYQYIGI